MWSEEPGGLALQRFAQLVQLADVLLGGDPDARPRARPRLDQPVAFQAPERVGDGDDAHPQLARQPAARKRRARADASAEDLVAHGEIRPLGEADARPRCHRLPRVEPQRGKAGR
jgi:hypothetical protein